MNVDLDDAGIGRHLDDVDARIGRRQIAFDVDRQAELRGGRLDGGEKLEIILEPLDRRHEHAKLAVARLDRERGAHRNAGERQRLALRHRTIGRDRSHSLCAPRPTVAACG